MGAPVPKVLLKVVSKGDPIDGNPQTIEQSILRRSVSAFASDEKCVRVVVCIPTEWRDEFEREVAGLMNVVLVTGGATRQDSVRLGVEHLASLGEPNLDLPVLVHDAARCFITRDLIDRVVAGVREFGAVTAGVRVIDSICRSDASGVVSAYVDRDSLWGVQTPQGFILRDLLQAHREAHRDGVVALDDAALVARLRSVYIVNGERSNIKITEPGDLT
jgi:2-C-methyl-D-erythritol 4-phosphate cytidylyltransferase